jgi:hypothetical protein
MLASAGLLLALPATAEARQCYRRVVEPPRYATVAEAVMISPAREIAETIPAVTREVEETVVVRPERSLTRVIPAEYGYEERTVEVAPAHREWRTRDEEGDVIGCWVNVPARFARLTRRVLVTPAREVEQVIPAETATELRTVVVEPARTVAREIPARYATRERAVLASPGGARWAPLEGCE